MLVALGVVLLLVALPVASLRARQAGPVPLTGTIYDVTGGVIPGVTVTLVDAAQNTSVATSAATGRFDFPPVAAGKYTLDVTLPGFRALRQELELRNARDWERAVILQVGELRESVTVSAGRITVQEQVPPAPAPRMPVRVGGDVRPPRKTVDVKPTYPASMRQAGLSGVVPIEAIIGRDGAVSSVRVLSAQVHPDFAIAAADAVRRWRFSPTLLNGAPVDVMMTVSVRFALN
ncbi:MAG TPA: TonB family protein [Vicinamibacterales bacterium]|nr:TonB family protein [Vicinamibacterales bacterium]